MSNISFTIYNDEDTNIAAFNIEGEATIRNEEELFNLFISKLENHTNFVFKLIDIKNIDLPFIQLLISIKNTVRELGKKITFEIELASASDIIVKNSGINLSQLLESSELKIANIP